MQMLQRRRLVADTMHFARISFAKQVSVHRCHNHGYQMKSYVVVMCDKHVLPSCGEQKGHLEVPSFGKAFATRPWNHLYCKALWPPVFQIIVCQLQAGTAHTSLQHDGGSPHRASNYLEKASLAVTALQVSLCICGGI